MTTTYQTKIAGKTDSGKSFSKTFEVSETAYETQQNAETLANAVIKIYDSGTTLASVSKTSTKKFDTPVTAS